MVSENTKYNEVIHKKLKKCEYCGRELTPIGLEYLYANFSPDNIEYERCTCKIYGTFRKTSCTSGVEFWTMAVYIIYY